MSRRQGRVTGNQGWLVKHKRKTEAVVVAAPFQLRNLVCTRLKFAKGDDLTRLDDLISRAVRILRRRREGEKHFHYASPFAWRIVILSSNISVEPSVKLAIRAAIWCRLKG